jgi:hypothetical protein
MLTQTPITYNETVTALKKSRSAIEQAIARGVLTKLPTTNLQQYLIKEQAMLFEKKQLRVSALSEHDLELWIQHKKQAETPITMKSELKVSASDLLPSKADIIEGTEELKDIMKRTFIGNLKPEEKAVMKEKKTPQFAL